MKLRLVLVGLTFLVLASAFSVLAQNTTDAGNRAENLRGQLLEVQAREAVLQERSKQLDEEMKPENIERSLAGVGSTRPEELREERRRQLQIQKTSVLTQLELLAKSRTNLESAVLRADAEAYQQSALGTSSISDQMLIRNLPVPLWIAAVVAAFVLALGVVGTILVIRRFKMSA